jgi:hypothetical protein
MTTSTIDTMRPALEPARPAWSELNQRWLVAAIDRLRARLEARAGDGPASVAEDCVERERPADFTPALLQCAQLFGLSPFERELLLLVAGLELDRGLRAAVAAVNGSRHATVSFSLALGVLTQPHWDALSPNAPLRYWRLLSLEPGAPLSEAALRVDERVLHFLTGVAAIDEQLAGVARYVRATRAPADLVDEELAARVRSAFAEQEDRGPVVLLHADPFDAAALRDLALAVAARRATSGLWIAARDLPADQGRLVDLARRIDREAVMTGAIPMVALRAAGDENAAAALATHVESALLWLGPPSDALATLPNPRRILRFELPSADAPRTQAALLARWKRATRGASDDPKLTAELNRAASQFHLGPSALDDVVEALDAADPATRATAVWSAAREAARGGLTTLAQRIVTSVTFDDLVLPPAHLAALRDIARQLRHRERVYREWGFGDKHARGQGLTALFAGESGTGKTLAAEAIANEVALDLYRVDLATVVSKYIGETEKNLKALFDAAESSGAVLLFDEADALFGKRSEVKDSHDRYANIEVAYLLQRVEQYRGLAILTTNMKGALDRAFLRRIRFVVQFPFPDTRARAEIWRRQFPPTAPVAALDYDALARLSLAGGHIRSIAVNAAFRAADDGGVIDQRLIGEAARAELIKLDRPTQELT